MMLRLSRPLMHRGGIACWRSRANLMYDKRQRSVSHFRSAWPAAAIVDSKSSSPGVACGWANAMTLRLSRPLINRVSIAYRRSRANLMYDKRQHSVFVY